MRPLRTRFLILCLIELLFVFDFCAALYEDQIKKFDWTIENIGEIIDAHFDWSDYSPRILVTTKENVLAALCPRTGAILWRKVFEEGPRGSIKFFHLESGDAIGSSAVARHAAVRPSTMLTVTGHAPAIVRGWSTLTGNVEWEWSIMSLQQDHAEQALWFMKNSFLYHVIQVWGSHLEVTKYFSISGQSNGHTSKLTAPWIQVGRCVLAAPFYVCLDNNQLIWIDLTEDGPQIKRKTVESFEQTPKVVKGRNGMIVVGNVIFELASDKSPCEKDANSNVFYSMKSNEPVLVLSSRNDKILQITEVSANTCEKSKETKTISIPQAEGYGDFSVVAVDCKQSRNINKIACHYLLSTSDGAIIMSDSEKIRWSREESFTKITAAEFSDLPLSDAEGAIENELSSKPGDIAGAFVRRLSSQILQVKQIFLTVMGLGTPPSATQRAGLIRDAFGLHKLIVAFTKNGKLFGIDNLTGKIYWQRYLPMIDGFGNDENIKLLVHRTAKHFPHPPLYLLIGRDKATGYGLIYRFNPITGQPDNGGIVKLNYRIKQLALLRESEHDFTKPLLLLDEHNNVHTYPETCPRELAHGMYMFTADKKTAILEGFYIDASSEKMTAKQIWKVNLGGQGNSHKLIRIAMKNPIEHVHSQGRVLSDRSVLYKYINPNLVAVVTQSLDSIHKYILNIYLVDVVSGSIVYSMSHRKARGPLHIVHSENWLVYSYYNDKVRRTELTTVELYEGKTQANSTIWSSLDALPAPLIEKQSYILPSNVETMRETITERGITNKHVLIGISSGAVVEMPWVLLDPRRPTSAANQAREEGAIPYIPELPLPTENFINYNQTISRIRNIHTAPSGLESTCLVIAYGLDIFVTRVAPSKTFDLLKEDFDYFLITVVLIALITGSFVAKHLSMRKALKQAWK